MTPAFWMWVSIFNALRTAVAGIRRRIARLRARMAHARRARSRARVAVIADADLRLYTGLTRADLERAFRDPVRRP